MAITVVFDPPLPTDPPATFDSKAFTLLGDLNTWSPQANSLASDVNNDSVAAVSAKVDAQSARNDAQSAQAAAEAARNLALTHRDDAEGFALTASGQATIATTKAGEASDSANDAAASAALAQSVVTSSSTLGVFHKADAGSVAFLKTGAGTLSIKAGTRIDILGSVVTFATNTAITMPTHVAGTDYAVWVKDDGNIEATSNHSAAPSAGNWRKIGGYHYAPGGNAAARAGGDTTPAINEYSLWDLKFRPACPDPRGMTLVADSFWADIYLLGVDHIVNGTSKYNVTIADGSSPPKIPLKFGGNGSTAYGSMNWWEANEVLQSHGKASPTYSQFAALAFGTTEAASGGTDPGSTVLRAAYTSKWGVMLSTGNLWVWGDEFGGGAAAASWAANTGGRGSTYQAENAVLFGGFWNGAAFSGSRASAWLFSPTNSADNIGARGVCDHLILN